MNIEMSCVLIGRFTQRLIGRYILEADWPKSTGLQLERRYRNKHSTGGIPYRGRMRTYAHGTAWKNKNFKQSYLLFYLVYRHKTKTRKEFQACTFKWMCQHTLTCPLHHASHVISGHVIWSRRRDHRIAMGGLGSYQVNPGLVLSWSGSMCRKIPLWKNFIKNTSDRHHVF